MLEIKTKLQLKQIIQKPFGSTIGVCWPQLTCNRIFSLTVTQQMKTLRLPEGWERDSGQGSVSNPSVHSNSHPAASSTSHVNCNGIASHLNTVRVTTLVTATTAVTGTVNEIAQLKPVAIRPKHNDASKKKDSTRKITTTFSFKKQSAYSCLLHLNYCISSYFIPFPIRISLLISS